MLQWVLDNALWEIDKSKQFFCGKQVPDEKTSKPGFMRIYAYFFA
jgi:hypothetical protein